MQELHFDGEFIKLGQALKLAGAVSSGTDAKVVITEGEVRVDGEVDMRRGRKLFGGEVVEFEDYVIKVINNADQVY